MRSVETPIVGASCLMFENKVMKKNKPGESSYNTAFTVYTVKLFLICEIELFFQTNYSTYTIHTNFLQSQCPSYLSYRCPPWYEACHIRVTNLWYRNQFDWFEKRHNACWKRFLVNHLFMVVFNLCLAHLYLKYTRFWKLNSTCWFHKNKYLFKVWKVPSFLRYTDMR